MPARVVQQYNKLVNKIKQKEFAPVYFLYGPEPFFIDRIAEVIQNNALNTSEKEFNLTTLYGGETDPQTLINTAKRYPMMADYQVVVLKEAHQMKKMNTLKKYLDNPVSTTILVICYKKKKVDKRTKFGKTVTQQATTFYARPVYDRHIPDWIINYLHQNGYEIKPEAAALLGEHLGTDLSKIANALEKLTLKLSEGEEVTPELIEKNIGISREYNTFELQDAVAQRDISKVYKIVQYFKANPKASPFPLTIGALYNFFSNLYQYHFLTDKSWGNVRKQLGLYRKFFAKKYEKAAEHFDKKQTVQVIQLLHEYDLRSKGVNNVSTSEGELLQEMIYKILHLNQVPLRSSMSSPTK